MIHMIHLVFCDYIIMSIMKIKQIIIQTRTLKQFLTGKYVYLL